MINQPLARKSGYEKYHRCVIEKAIALIKRAHKDSKIRKVIGERLMESLTKAKSSNSFSRIKPATKEEKVVYFIFRGLIEISQAYENLLDAIIFIRQCPQYVPYRGRYVTKAKYLRYHIEKYLEEIYILHKRLERYGNAIANQYYGNHKQRKSEIKAEVSRLLKNFEGICQTRSKHAHESRYNDGHLERLDLVELLTHSVSSSDPLHHLKDFNRSWFLPEVKREWNKTIEHNNGEIKELLDFYFDFLYPYIFDSRGNFVIK